MNVETPIMREIRAALVRAGGLRLWRNNTGKVHGWLVQPGCDRRRVDVDFGLGLGGADLVGLLVGSGRFFACEVKTPIGRASKEQVLWHRVIADAGGYACFATNPTDALSHLERALAGAVSPRP